VVPYGVIGVLMPRIAELVSGGDEARASALTWRTAWVTMAVSGALAVGLAVAGGPLLGLLYGDAAYEAGGSALTGVSVSVALYAGFAVLTSAAIGWGRSAVFSAGIVVATVVEVGLLIAFGGRSPGAAGWSVAVSAAVGLLGVAAWLRARPLGAD
jgi:O-antigen/teichoic acid export membrane protein